MSSISPQLSNSLRSMRRRLKFIVPYLPFLHYSERKLFLGIIDLLILGGTLSFLALNSRSAFDGSLTMIWSRIHWFLVFWAVWFALGFISGVYDLLNASNPIKSLWIAGGTACIASGLYLLIPYVTPVLPERRLYIVLFPVLTTVGIIIWRVLYATVFVQSVFRQRALVIGAGESGCELANAVKYVQQVTQESSDGMGYEIDGFVDDDPAKQGQQLAGIPILGTGKDLLALVKKKRPHEIVLAITDTQTIRPELFQHILDCREMGIPITTMASLYERIGGRVPINHAGRNIHVVLPVDRPVSYRLYLLVQRMIDMVIGTLGLMIAGILMPFVWVANRLNQDRGALFFHQERVGEAGETFFVIKFRSMMVDAEKETGAIWATKDDPRITRVGHFLRKTRLDEIPQFWNVLKGEMSLIGPRPERPHFVERLGQEIPFYRVRHAVKPGITGWAQTMYRYGASTEDSRIKLEYDLYYIKHQSLYLDLQILLKTIQVVLGLKGR